MILMHSEGSHGQGKADTPVCSGRKPGHGGKAFMEMGMRNYDTQQQGSASGLYKAFLA